MQRNSNHTTIVTIEKVVDETPTVRTLYFSDDVMSNVLPGQFAMVWIPGINELPMSVMISNESGKAAFTVRKHGLASTGLFNIKTGEKIGVRGPYGNAFDIEIQELGYLQLSVRTSQVYPQENEELFFKLSQQFVY